MRKAEEAELYQLSKIPRNEPIDETTIHSLTDLHILCSNDIQNAVTNDIYNYGYFLSAKKGTNMKDLRSYNRVLIPSNLYEVIEKFFYARIKHNGKLLTGDHKKLYNILSLLLSSSYNKRSEQRLYAICELIPECKRLRDECIKYIDILVDKIQSCIRNPSGIEDISSPIVIKIYNSILENEPDLISSTFDVNFLIRSYIQSKMYLDSLYESILQDILS
jgi:hypothetical protein